MNINSISNALIILLISSTLLACNPLYYTSDNISGLIIDKNTEKPIKNAVVIARWEVRRPKFIGHGGLYKNIQIIETTTNLDGIFKLPEWGPIYSGNLWSMAAENPRITILKSGYMPKTISNYYSRGNFEAARMFLENTYKRKHKHTNIKFSSDEIVIELQPVTNKSKYAKYLGATDHNVCDYKNYRRTPLCFTFFRDERKRLSSIGVKEYFHIDNMLERMPEEDKQFILEKSNLTKQSSGTN